MVNICQRVKKTISEHCQKILKETYLEKLYPIILLFIYKDVLYK